VVETPGRPTLARLGERLHKPITGSSPVLDTVVALTADLVGNEQSKCEKGGDDMQPTPVFPAIVRVMNLLRVGVAAMAVSFIGVLLGFALV
jgi:hypothetical protein